MHRTKHGQRLTTFCSSLTLSASPLSQLISHLPRVLTSGGGHASGGDQYHSTS